MTILTKEADLYKFINDKKNTHLNTSQKVLYSHFNKIIISSLTNCYNKIVQMDLTIKCVNTINILFWFLIEYSRNIKLSSFLCDRAILLFTEYILMISSPMLLNKISSDIDITEVKTFVYKKTIGPLSVNNFKKKIYPSKYYKFCNLIKDIYCLLFIKIEKIFIDDGDIKVITTEFNRYQVCLNNYINDEIFYKENMHDVETKILETFLGESELIESLSSVVFLNSIIIMLIACKLYKIDNIKYIERILFLVNQKYPKEIINFTVIDKINVYTELDKIHSELL